MSLARQLLGIPDWRPEHPLAVAEVWEPLDDFHRCENMPDGAQYYENPKYQVTVRRYSEDPVFGSRGGMVQLGISSADGTARHDWRDFQQIKNIFVGPEAEAFELYPAESRLLDPSNYYTLWCFPSCKIKVGKHIRSVVDAASADAPQRAWSCPEKKDEKK